MPKTKGAHHRGTYHVASAKCRAAAYADPSTRCRRCRLTLTEARRRWGPRVRWTAGHVNRAEVGGQLLPECSHCAGREGASITNSRRKTRTVKVSRSW